MLGWNEYARESPDYDPSKMHQYTYYYGSVFIQALVESEGCWRWACHLGGIIITVLFTVVVKKADPIALRLNLHPHGHTPDQTLANVTRQCPGVIVPLCSQSDSVRGASSHSEQCVTLAGVKPTQALAAVHSPPSPPPPPPPPPPHRT